MSDSSFCPDLSSFEQYRTGMLSATELESLTRHLDSCERCAETVERLMAQDTLLDGLQAPSAEDTPRLEEGVQVLIGLLSSRPPWLNPEFAEAATVRKEATREETHYPDAHVAQEEIYHFLRPALAGTERVLIGPYRIVRALGRGSTGIVLEAED